MSTVFDLPGVLILNWDEQKKQGTLVLRENVDFSFEMADGRICVPKNCEKLKVKKLG